MSLDLPPSTPLGQAKAVTRAASRHPGGTDCPLCGQHVEVYRRTITRTMAQALGALWQAGSRPGGGSEPGTALHWPTVLDAAGITRADEAKLAMWGLVEQPDGAGPGMWRVTWAGVRYLDGQEVPRYALVYNGRCLGFDTEPTTITAALGTGFDLSDAQASGEPAPLTDQG